ncbi:MAG: hypothetical protein ACE5PM_09865 [Candidatus Hydrothermarchaeales archaeon]
MATTGDILGIGLAILGIAIVLVGISLWSMTKPVPLAVEYTRGEYRYSLSYPELQALRMSGYAELLLISSNLLEGFAVLTMIYGGFRLIWSGLHLYPFWDHLRPYLRSNYVRIWE